MSPLHCNCYMLLHALLLVLQALKCFDTLNFFLNFSFTAIYRKRYNLLPMSQQASAVISLLLWSDLTHDAQTLHKLDNFCSYVYDGVWDITSNTHVKIVNTDR